jgi:hypothetical protein
MCQDDVGRGCGQLCSVFAYLSGTTTSPTGINPHVLANAPARLLQSLQECPDPGLKIRIVRGYVKEHANAPNALGMLPPRRERPCCRAAEKRDELAPSHCLPRDLGQGIVATLGNALKGVRHETGRCPLWVKSRHLQCKQRCPL